MNSKNFPAKKAERQAKAHDRLVEAWKHVPDRDMPPAVQHEMNVLRDAMTVEEARTVRTKKDRRNQAKATR